MAHPSRIARSLMEFAPTLFRAMSAAMRGHGADDPTTLVQLHTLQVLGREARTFKALCAHRNVAPATLSRTIESMVKRGWVERAPHPDDRRQRVLMLTAEGRRELETAGAEAQAKLAEALAGLTAEERQTVSEALRILDEALRSERARGCAPAPADRARKE